MVGTFVRPIGARPSPHFLAPTDFLISAAVIGSDDAFVSGTKGRKVRLSILRLPSAQHFRVEFEDLPEPLRVLPGVGVTLQCADDERRGFVRHGRGILIQSEVGPTAFLARMDQPSLLQDRCVPGYGRRCQAEQLDDLAQAQFAAVEGSNDSKAISIGQGLHYG